MASGAADGFLRSLDAEAVRVRSQAQADSTGMLLYCVLREFDFYVKNLADGRIAHEDRYDQLNFLKLGLPPVIRAIFAREGPFRYPTVMVPGDRALATRIFTLVTHAGFVEHGRRFAHAAKAGVCTIEEVDPARYRVMIPHQFRNLDYYEEWQSERFRSAHQAAYRKHLDQALSSVRPDIEKLLSDNVYPFQTHFIGYNAHPLLDEYFFGLAYSELQFEQGFDEFHHKLTFGGIPYQKYALTAIFLASLAMKHQAFSETLVKKHPTVQLGNIITITAPKPEMVQSIREAVNYFGASLPSYIDMTEADAEQIFRVLLLSRHTAPLLERTMAPLPYLVDFSSSHVVKVCAGRDATFDFLLRSLRFNFPKDYDRNQGTRENSFRLALKRVLSEMVPNLRFRENVRLRKEGRHVTDLDMVVIDDTLKNVLILQLKHQDPYGADLRDRTNKGERLKQEAVKWSTAVSEWLSAASSDEINSVLQLRKAFQIGQIHLGILTKHFAHFLSEVTLPRCSFYATWLQLHMAYADLQRGGNKALTLSDLIERLESKAIHKAAPERFMYGARDEFVLDTIRFTVEQASAS
jgi:hypothetical protein